MMAHLPSLLPLLLLLPAPAWPQHLHASWQSGSTNMTWRESQHYCQEHGLGMASLDTPASEAMYLTVAANLPPTIKFFWTGGQLEGPAGGARSVRWPLGGASSRVVAGTFPWSLGSPGTEPGKDCVAIIDTREAGPRLFDIGCDHRKPVICQ